MFFKYKYMLVLALALSLSGCNGFGQRAESVTGGAVPPSAGLVESGRVDYRLPPKVTLCGESLDLSRPSVYERLESEFLRVVNHSAQVALWQRRAELYFPKIEAELRAAGLPDDLKYLAVAESDLRPWVQSPAGALGLWQFMPATARYFGLTVNQKVDHRHLPENILNAATTHLASLYARFGSWSLAMAAYNAGDGRIARAMAAQNANDYYDLDLPRETERYVYRIAAIKVVMENAALYEVGEKVPAARYNPLKCQEKTLTVAAGSTWPAVAMQAGCDYKTLRMLNPHLRESTPPAGQLVLRVPGGS